MFKMSKVSVILVMVVMVTSLLGGVAQACWNNNYYNNQQVGSASIFMPYNDCNQASVVNDLQNLNGVTLYPGNWIHLGNMNWQAANVMRMALQSAGIYTNNGNDIQIQQQFRIEVYTNNMGNGTNTEVRIFRW